MRRRVAQPERGTVPGSLFRFVYAEWADEEGDGPPSASWPSNEASSWYAVRARRRWMDARREYAAANGLDYADTFHPEWRRWHGSAGAG